MLAGHMKPNRDCLFSGSPQWAAGEGGSGVEEESLCDTMTPASCQAGRLLFPLGANHPNGKRDEELRLRFAL